MAAFAPTRTLSELISDITFSYFHMAVCHIYVLIFNILLSVYPNTVFSVLKNYLKLFIDNLSSFLSLVIVFECHLTPGPFFIKRCYLFTRIRASQRWVEKTSGIRHNILVVSCTHSQIRDWFPHSGLTTSDIQVHSLTAKSPRSSVFLSLLKQTYLKYLKKARLLTLNQKWCGSILAEVLGDEPVWVLKGEFDLNRISDGKKKWWKEEVKNMLHLSQ